VLATRCHKAISLSLDDLHVSSAHFPTIGPASLERKKILEAT
jgi:hypothetical protein